MGGILVNVNFAAVGTCAVVFNLLLISKEILRFRATPFTGWQMVTFPGLIIYQR